MMHVVTEVDELLAQLRSERWEAAAGAADRLAQVPGHEVTVALAEALDAHDTAITVAAVAALVQRDDDASAELMWHVMLDMDEDMYDETWFFLNLWPKSPIVQELERRHTAQA